MDDDFLIVDKKILPKCYQQVVEAKNNLKKDPNLKVAQACKMANISRSTFYKYQNSIFSYHKNVNARKMVFSLILSHNTGALSRFCNILSDLNISILTISQSLPIGKDASIMVSCDISGMQCSLESLKKLLESSSEIHRFEILAFEN